MVAVGTATMMFGFKLDGASRAAGIVTTALAFGLVLLALVYTIGAISGCHVNPAVTLGFVVSAAHAGARGGRLLDRPVRRRHRRGLVLWGIVEGSPIYSRHTVGLGAEGYGRASMINLNAAGAVGIEMVLTFVFVLVVLSATSRIGSPGFAGLAVGLALSAVHLVGIGLDGTSVNPARSLAPALVIGAGR